MASTYSTSTPSPAFATVPFPTMRSALSSPVGGDPAGTTTVGALPAVPAGERSLMGMDAFVGAEPLPAAEVVVDEEAPEELPHAARPRAEADSITSNQARRRNTRYGRSDCYVPLLPADQCEVLHVLHHGLELGLQVLVQLLDKFVATHVPSAVGQIVSART